MNRRSSSRELETTIRTKERFRGEKGKPPGRVRRRGAAIIFAMLALLLASMMIAALLQMTAVSQRQMLREQFRLQAGLLADAGLQRAIVRLQNQPDWNDEVWQISSDDLTTGFAAEVRMTVEEEPDSTAKILKVTAQYPVNNPSVVRVIRQRRMP